MTKLDLAKKYKLYYKAGNSPELADFSKIHYLSIEGKGEPAGNVFMNKIEALYPLAYGIKKVYKDQGQDFVVPKLEGLWWVESDLPALEIPRTEWCWKLLIMMPDFVTKEIFLSVRSTVAEKKKNSTIEEISFEHIKEGKCVQMMHVGPYSSEPETINMLLTSALHKKYSK